MNKVFTVLIFMIYHICYSQNVKIEIADYVKNIDSTEYSTYQYVNASYSYSRHLLVIVTDKDVFMKIHTNIPKLFFSKQEYTDVNLLGITGFNKNYISNVDKKIMDIFIKAIIKYRNDNNLLPYSEDQLYSNINYIETTDDLCKLLICRNRLQKKYTNRKQK